MNFGAAWDNAEGIITILALLPMVGLLIVMSQNMTNPEFDMLAAFELGMLLIVNALLPALGVTPVLALIFYVFGNASGMSSGL